MERNLKNEDHLSIKPIDQARFTDRLEIEYEQQWDELKSAAIDLGVDMIQFAVPLWKDKALPSVIRDRAMLLLTDKGSKKRWFHKDWGMLGVTSYFTGVYKFNLDLVEGHEDEFKVWIDEALNYGNIIDDQILCSLSYEFFTNDSWDQERFERTLEGFDHRKVQAAWDIPIEGFYTHSSATLPYIDDILKNQSVDKTNTKMKNWAQQKHSLFMKNFVVNEKVLPPWLRDLRRYEVRETVESLHKRHENDEQLPENLIAIYEKYGLDFWKGLTRNSMYSEKTNILKYLNQFSQESIEHYIKVCYEEAINNIHTELRLDEEQALLAHIKGPVPRKLAEYAVTLNTHRQKHEALLESGRQEREKEQALKREQDRIAYLAKKPERDKAEQKRAITRNRYELARKALQNSND